MRVRWIPLLPDRRGGGAVALFHEIPENRHEESGGAEQGLEKSGGGEFAEIADDQSGLVCDEIKVGWVRPRAADG